MNKRYIYPFVAIALGLAVAAQFGGGGFRGPGATLRGPTSSTDNAIARFDGTNGRRLQDSSTVTITDAGLVGIGAVATSFPLEISATTTTMQQTRYNATASFGSGIQVRRSRGATVGTDTVVQSGDNLGVVSFQGFDSNTYENAAAIRAEVDAAPGDGDMPGRLLFLTTPDDSTTMSERMRIDRDGNVTKISNPCFLAFNSATDADVTGNNTVATVDFDTEVFDQGNDFTADTFTAPVTGRYLLTAVVQLLGIGTAADLSLIRIDTSNRNYRGSRFDIAADFPGVIGHTITVVADMDSGDTATVVANVDGVGADTVDIEGQATELVTSFSGCLLS